MTDLDKMSLLPCPFCGAQPRTGYANSGIPGMEDCGYAYIECCDVHVHREEDEECVAAWNKRAALLTAPPGYVLVDRATLLEMRDVAMRWTRAGRLPECGAFSQIAQDADAMLAAAPEVK